MKQPEFVAVLKSSIWEWEDLQLSELSHTKCIFKSELHEVDLKEGWVFVIQKLNTQYCGLLLVDEELNLHLFASLDYSTKIDCDEDLIGSGSRSVTISNASISTASSDLVTKYEFYLSNKYPDLELRFLEALNNLKNLFNSHPETFGSEEWQSKNRQWCLEFRNKYDSHIRQLKEALENPSADETIDDNDPVTAPVNENNKLFLTCPVPERSGSMNSIESRPREGYLLDGSSTGSERSSSFTGSVRSECSQVSKRSIKIYTKPEDRPYVGFKDLKLFLTTFNVNMQTSTIEGEANFVHIVQDWLQHDDIIRNTPDIIVICMQECGGLNRVSNFLTSLDEKIQSDWKSAISRVLQPLNLCDPPFEVNVGCTYMLVYVNNAILPDTKFKHKAEVPLGQIGMANKGACAIQLSVHEQKFLFIGLHLAAHDDHQSERMRQIEKLCYYYRPLIKSSHYVFWMGDFNFRTAVDEPVIQTYDFLWLSNGLSEKYSDYRSKDEWRKQRLTTAGSDRIDFYNLSEAEISFPPTYKFEPGRRPDTDVRTGHRVLPYEVSHRPSWCDRIFYYSVNSESQLRVQSYNCELKCTLSDHKPVFLRILAQIEFLDRAKRNAVHRATEIRNNACRPNADLDRPLHNIPSEDDCIKLMDSYQIDTHLSLKEDLDEARFLFRCTCGDTCPFYRKQFGASEFEYDPTLVDHIKHNNSPVSFITVNEYQGRIIAGYPADIGFDVQITERNIHELYKLKNRKFATLVPKSRTSKFEQAQIDLIFCLYREDPFRRTWLKGADKYIAVNINVSAYMHGLSPTALCYVEQPICRESVRSLCDIVEISEKFLCRSTGSFQSFFFNDSSVKPPPLECPKEIVFAIDTILDLLKTCQRDEAAFLTTQLFQMHSMKGQRDTVHHQPPLQFASLLPSDERSGYSDEGATAGDAMFSTAVSEESLHFAINWLTGVSDYNKRPFSTQYENQLFVIDLSRALLLYFKSIEGSLFGQSALPKICTTMTRQEIIQSLLIPEHNKTVINYFFRFLARSVVPHFPDDINYCDQETPLESLKNTLMDACFPQSKLELGLKKRSQVLHILLEQYSR